MFDPTIGRWFEEDPEGFAAGDMSLYRYVGNKPTNATDPSGFEWIKFKYTSDQGIKVGPKIPDGVQATFIDKPGDAKKPGNKLEIWALGGVIRGKFTPEGGKEVLFGKCLPDWGVNEWTVDYDDKGYIKTLYWYNFGPNFTTVGGLTPQKVVEYFKEELGKAKDAMKPGDTTEKVLAKFIEDHSSRLAILGEKHPLFKVSFTTYDTVRYKLVKSGDGYTMSVERLYFNITSGKYEWAGDGTTKADGSK